MAPTVYSGLSEEYKKRIESKFGDATPQYIIMLEKLLQISVSCTPDTLEKFRTEISRQVSEINQYVGQFGFLCFAFIVVDEMKK